jgi:hypothetical protein
MPTTYKYGFLPKSREKALEAALAEFHECKMQAKKLEQEAKALNERMEFLGGLLSFGVARMMPDGELGKKVKAVIGEE